MSDFLFEILSEEIPAHFMPSAISQLKELFAKRLAEERISYDEIKTYGTPRRLAVVVEGISLTQEDMTIESKGPARKIAFDAAGKPTKAAEGFARSQGLAIDEVGFREIDGTQYLYAVKQSIGEPTEAVLPKLLPAIVHALRFPKFMRWGDSDLQFARPIHSFISLLGPKVISFELENIPVGNTTSGHRTLCNNVVVVQKPADYVENLRNAFVMVDPREREELIVGQVQACATACGGEVDFDPDLLEEVNYLVEYPTALFGGFSKDYLAVPKQCLITSMKENQKYFPVTDAQGELLPYFITVRNGDSRHLDVVREGNEKVLNARLSDAMFFFTEDQKKPLVENFAKLKNVVFHEKLGTLHEKCLRIAENAKWLAQKTGADVDPADIDRAAMLIKADLVSNMVFEFTELQGIMGRVYARNSGEKEIVSEAIYEHYLPRFSGDELPTSALGALMAISDKMDSIAGCFGIGIIPTGSQDPYALRRQALGISHIILSMGWDVDLRDIAMQAAALYAAAGKAAIAPEDTVKSILEFFDLRIRNILSDKRFPQEIIDAASAAGLSAPQLALARCEALQAAREEAWFGEMVLAYKRAINLAKKAEKNAGAHSVIEAAFVHETEGQLWASMTTANAEYEAQCAKQDIAAALLTAASLTKAINEFFDKVLIMDENPEVRMNRLSMLVVLRDMILKIGDLSKLG